MSLQSITEKAVDKFAEGKDGEAFDPAIILVIMDLIRQFVELFQGCGQSAKDVVKITGRPSWLQRRMVIRQVRRDMGRRGFRENGREVVAAILETGKDLTVKEVREALEEVE